VYRNYVRRDSGFPRADCYGKTHKMVDKERNIIPSACAMGLEGFVAITALIAACSLEPGD